MLLQKHTCGVSVSVTQVHVGPDPRNTETRAGGLAAREIFVRPLRLRGYTQMIPARRPENPARHKGDTHAGTDGCLLKETPVTLEHGNRLLHQTPAWAEHLEMF